MHALDIPCLRKIMTHPQGDGMGPLLTQKSVEATWYVMSVTKRREMVVGVAPRS